MNDKTPNSKRQSTKATFFDAGVYLTRDVNGAYNSTRLKQSVDPLVSYRLNGKKGGYLTG